MSERVGYKKSVHMSMSGAKQAMTLRKPSEWLIKELRSDQYLMDRIKEGDFKHNTFHVHRLPLGVVLLESWYDPSLKLGETIMIDTPEGV